MGVGRHRGTAAVAAVGQVAHALGTERAVAGVRVFAAVWGTSMVVTYGAYPAGHAWLRTFGVASLVVYLGCALGLWVVAERLGAGTSRLARAGLLLDTTIVVAMLMVFMYDRSSLWILVFLLPVEAAMRYRLAGALVAWIVVTAVYTARELLSGELFGNEVSPRSVVFRMGVLLLLSVMVGLMARELSSARQRMDAALEELRRLDRFRTRLIASLAHDVRSPLAGIQMAGEALRSGDWPEEHRTRLAEGIIRQSQRLQRLAADLIDMARSGEGTLTLHPVEVDVAALVREIAEEHDEVRVEGPEVLPTVLDGSRLEQIVRNLVANACRHGAPPVDVTLARTHGGLVLIVRDHGPGIPPEVADRLFEAFAGDGHADSTGLGLWIVRELTEAHGGRISVRHPQGGGAEFVVVLPTMAPTSDQGSSPTPASQA